MINRKRPLVVMGASAGGFTALSELLPALPAGYPLPVVIALHLHPLQTGAYLEGFLKTCAVRVKEAEEKEAIQPGHVYFAPANYHLLIEKNRTLSLSIDPKVNYARPSIDVLFESAVEACAPYLIGVLLTGANNDGANGLRRIKEAGGQTIVQDPQTAASATMPKAALDLTPADHILPLAGICRLLIDYSRTDIVCN